MFGLYVPCTHTRGDATQTPEHKNKRNQMFTQFDPNGNGYLSLAEVDKVSPHTPTEGIQNYAFPFLETERLQSRITTHSCGSRMMSRFVQEHIKNRGAGRPTTRISRISEFRMPEVCLCVSFSRSSTKSDLKRVIP